MFQTCRWANPLFLLLRTKALGQPCLLHLPGSPMGSAFQAHPGMESDHLPSGSLLCAHSVARHQAAPGVRPSMSLLPTLSSFRPQGTPCHVRSTGAPHSFSGLCGSMSCRCSWLGEPGTPGDCSFSEAKRQQEYLCSHTCEQMFS